jgi:hypothetical protein
MAVPPIDEDACEGPEEERGKLACEADDAEKEG